MVEGAPTGRPILHAELLSIGSELIHGETRDTNAGELAASLTEMGIRVGRITALPDDLVAATDAFSGALDRADLVVSTGGLGPTPDDLTREAIAAACGETPAVDPELATWLRALFERRGLGFPEANLKQAWLIPSATAITNGNGTAPGWWVDRSDGRILVALPGPPREMRPMWRDRVVPRLHSRALGDGRVSRTLRLTGIGESHVADRLGDLLRARNPTVATYARAEAVDVRISAVTERPEGGPVRSASELVADAERRIRAALGDHVWAQDGTTWATALDELLGDRGWRLATAEAGTAGTLVGLIGGMSRLALAEVVGGASDAMTSAPASAAGELATAVRLRAGVDIGVGLVATAHGEDLAVTVAVATPGGLEIAERVAFLAGEMGRARAAINAAAVLRTHLLTSPATPDASAAATAGRTS